MGREDPFRRESPIRLVPRFAVQQTRTSLQGDAFADLLAQPDNGGILAGREQDFAEAIARARGRESAIEEAQRRASQPSPFDFAVGSSRLPSDISIRLGEQLAERRDFLPIPLEEQDAHVVARRLGLAESDIGTILDEMLAEARILQRFRDEAIRNAELAVAAQYDEQLADLDRRIKELQAAQADMAAAVEQRQTTVAPAFQTAIDEAGQISETGEVLATQTAEDARASIVADMADSTTAMGELAATIGADDPDVAAEFANLVGDFEKEYVRQVTEGEATEKRLFDAAEAFAVASARLAHSTDTRLAAERGALVSEQLQDKIRTLIDMKSELAEDAALARADARRQAGFNIDPMSLDTLIGQGFLRLFEDEGIDADHASLFQSDFTGLRQLGIFNSDELNAHLDRLQADFADDLAIWREDVQALRDDGVSEERIRALAPEPVFTLWDGGPEFTPEARGVLTRMFDVYQAANDRWSAAQTNLEEYFLLNGLADANGFLEGTGFLVPVKGRSSGDGFGFLMAPAAQAWEDMRETAEAMGVTLTFGDHYRSWDTQNNAYERFIRTGTNLAGNPVPNIAAPGTSYHGMGLALDITSGSETTAWLRQYGPTFGWWPIPNEPWHWEYRGRENWHWDRTATSVAVSPATDKQIASTVPKPTSVVGPATDKLSDTIKGLLA